MPETLIIAASPRPGGNSDHAAKLLAPALGPQAALVHLRGLHLRPCDGCGGCKRGPCVHQDDATALHRRMLAADVVLFCAPIYYYHLPAHFKALIDRSQWVYEAKRRADPDIATLPTRPAASVLIAGRPRGDRLFQGAALTLDYFCEPFHLHHATPLELRGYDAPGDLAADPEACARVEAYVRTLVMTPPRT